MGVRRSNHVPIALTSLGRIREIMGSRARRNYEPKPADLALWGRARSHVRDIFLYLAHMNVRGKETPVWAADDTARMIGPECASQDCMKRIMGCK